MGSDVNEDSLMGMPSNLELRCCTTLQQRPSDLGINNSFNLEQMMRSTTKLRAGTKNRGREEWFSSEQHLNVYLDCSALAPVFSLTGTIHVTTVICSLVCCLWCTLSADHTLRS